MNFLYNTSMKYYIVTYGCQMNVHESEKLASICEKMGYTLADKREDAQLIIFNTCAIREGAEDRESLEMLGRLKNSKSSTLRLLLPCAVA